MLILVYGTPKSGETLIYQMLWDILQDRGFPQEKLRRTVLRHLPGVSNGGLVPTNWIQFKNVLKLAQDESFLLARTHGSMTPEIRNQIQIGNIKLFITRRDIEASALALLRHAQNRIQINDPDELGSQDVLTKKDAIKKVKLLQERTSNWVEVNQGFCKSFQEIIADLSGTFNSLVTSLDVGKVSSNVYGQYKMFSRHIKRDEAAISNVKQPPLIYTGLVSGIGIVSKINAKKGQLYATITTNYSWSYVKGSNRFLHSGFDCSVEYTVQKSRETAEWTTAIPNQIQGNSEVPIWQVGTKLNLEKASYLGDDLGGQYMFGIPNSVARITYVEKNADRILIRLLPLNKLKDQMGVNTAFLGNGIALTVAKVHLDGTFDVQVKAFTQQTTTISDLQVNQLIAIEPELIKQARIPPPFVSN